MLVKLTTIGREISFNAIDTSTPNPLKCGGTGGCQGSIPQLAYSYVQLFGLATDKDYLVILRPVLRHFV
jgi:hypothetical protein